MPGGLEWINPDGPWWSNVHNSLILLQFMLDHGVISNAA